MVVERGFSTMELMLCFAAASITRRGSPWMVV